MKDSICGTAILLAAGLVIACAGGILWSIPFATYAWYDVGVLFSAVTFIILFAIVIMEKS
jgi:hypothetical protein